MINFFLETVIEENSIMAQQDTDSKIKENAVEERNKLQPFSPMSTLQNSNQEYIDKEIDEQILIVE